MKHDKLAGIPYVLGLNRVKRAYTGGRLLNEWQGLEPVEDGKFSEEFLVSSIEVSNKSVAETEGVSLAVLPDGTTETLPSLIARDYKAFLGMDYAGKRSMGVLARAGDTTVRHVLQCHPDADFAKENLGFPNGKAEAWYILKTRSIDGQEPYLYAGFKKGVTKELWATLYQEQNISGMLACLHKIPVTEGGVYFVEAGMPHCLGPGILFVEIHEPCDYTFKVEREYLPDKTFTDYEMNYGIGEDKMLEAFHYDTYSQEEIRKKCVVQPKVSLKTDQVTVEEIVSYQLSRHFKVEKYTFSDMVSIPEFGGHRIAVTVAGGCDILAEQGTCRAGQGRGIFLPAGVKGLRLSPAEDQATVLLCYPRTDEISPKDVFKNPIQIGVLVKDLNSYLANLNDVFGMGPFRIAEYPPAGSTPYREYRGKDGNFIAKFCFYHLGNIELELIQPISGASIWQDHIDRHGEGIHHIKFLIPEHEPIERYLNRHGYHISQQGQGVGPNKDRVWAFYDTYGDVGFDVEVMNE